MFSVYFLLIVLAYLVIKKWMDKKDIIFNLKSLYLRETVLVKDNHKITLLGMMHVAKKDFYDTIRNNKDYKGLFVLTEGVRSDNKAKKGSYKVVADILGLDLQEKELFDSFQNKNADFHIDDFSEETRSYIKDIFSVFAALEMQDADKLIESYSKIQEQGKEKRKEVMSEILHERNKSLYAHIEENNDKDLLIPWGARHMKEVKLWLLNDGYEVYSTKTYKVLDFWQSIGSMITFYKNNKPFVDEIKEKANKK